MKKSDILHLEILAAITPVITHLTVIRSVSIYLYGVGLVMLDSFTTPQRPGEGKLRGGWVSIFVLRSISSLSWALLSSYSLIQLNLHPSLRIPLRILCRLFLLLLLFFLRVRVSLSLPVFSQLEREDIKWAVSMMKNTLSASPLKSKTLANMNKLPFNWYSILYFLSELLFGSLFIWPWSSDSQETPS